MTNPGPISFLRLAHWQLKLAVASATRGSGARLGQRVTFLGLGLLSLTLLTLGLYWTLVESIDRTPGARWLFDLALHSAWLGSLAMVLFFNLGLLLHVVFFSRDLPFLMAAPIPPERVLALRFVEGMWSSLILNLFLSLPASLAVGLVAGAGPHYYIIFLMAQLAFLAIPVALTYLLGIPLARWVSTSRLRAIFSVVGFALAIFFWSLPQVATSHVRTAREWSEVLRHGQAILRLFERPASMLWPSTWAAAAQVSALHGDFGGAWWRLGVLIAGAGLLVALSIRQAARSYLEGWVRLAPVADTHRVKSGQYRFLMRLMPGAWRPVLRKDLTIVTRDFRIGFQLYGLGALMCLLPFMTRSAQPGGDPSNLSPMAGLASAVGASVLVGSQAGILVVPMEGRAAWRLLYSPLPLRHLAAAKWVGAMLLTLPVVLAQSALLRLLFDRSWAESLHGGLIAFASALAGTAFGVWVGAAFANFDWDHPRRMITPGAHVIWTIGVGIIAFAIVLFIQLSHWGGAGILPGFPGAGIAFGSLAAAGVCGFVAMQGTIRRLERREWGGSS